MRSHQNFTATSLRVSYSILALGLLSDAIGGTLYGMFRKRGDLGTMPQPAARQAGAAARVPAGPLPELPSATEWSVGEEVASARDVLTLSTVCTCGHTRREHRGPRMEVADSCLECSCEEFTWARGAPESDEQLIEKLRAGLDRVERLQEIVAGLGSQIDDQTLDREEWLAWRRDFCGEELLAGTNVANNGNGNSNVDRAGAELPPIVAQLHVCHCQHATIVSIGRAELYVGVKEAVFVVAEGDTPQRWNVVWRGTLNALAHAGR